ncbi:hypothetical protein E9529_21050, partial [Blastococcus sp. KM273128]|uniref:hypothetical protein n=1 Tax=Blastococcus sp. KM273128 TaxID=2570314 RepID=UPI001F3ACFFC
MTGLLVVLLGLAVSGAAPARAVDDPTRPDARVTHGPSCRPGGIVVEVVAGNAPYAVVLTTGRTPSGEDAAVLEPYGSVVLRTGDVAPGETIDPGLEFTARDGSGVTFVDELADYTLTRPTVEDCEAAMSPPPSRGCARRRGSRRPGPRSARASPSRSRPLPRRPRPSAGSSRSRRSPA